MIACTTLAVQGGKPQFSQPHGLYDQPSLSVAITASSPQAHIVYTTDGSLPTAQSQRYTTPLTLTATTTLRAAEVVDGKVSGDVATASYIFVASVLTQPNNPEGYPDTWGSYTTIWGTATADYEMDPEMTLDPTLQPKIVQGLKDLPLLSIVSDKDNFFSHDNDSLTGGIYIYTGPPVGDPTGHGWTRTASVELMGGPQHHDLSTSCGIRLHGGHGRLAEKNPKHSFRLVFKKEYGAGKLEYPLFGQDQPQEFDQLVLRCHFGNSWQTWNDNARWKAQYARDVWARSMQRKMGWPAANALYVHLFINGMYWGLYNVAERIDDLFCKSRLGGKKSEQDVVKIEEDGGNHHEATEGTLDAWQLMVATAHKASDDAYYYRLEGKDAQGNDDPELEKLLDVDNFIDYMLINHYAGNTDWDHHNWYAIRRQGPESQGFRFVCWDTEMIFEGPWDDVLDVNNRGGYPTGIFHDLLQNPKFAKRYLSRARKLLADDGMLGHDAVVELWDSLYHTIATAVYDEAARWGDYRRDVHPYSAPGKLYTVDDYYLPERRRLLTEYFPYRSQIVMESIEAKVAIDDFEAPEGWERLTAAMFHEWDGTDANAQPTDRSVGVDWNLGSNVENGGVVAGFASVGHILYADLSRYSQLVVRGSGYGLRILANRLVDHGPWKQIIVDLSPNDPYWDDGIGAIVLPLDDLRTVPTNEGVQRNDDFVHLNAIKVNWGASANIQAIYLVPAEEQLAVDVITACHTGHDQYFTLSGQRVDNPKPGIYIKNGKKVIVKQR